jgi:hypothetical protein
MWEERLVHLFQGRGGEGEALDKLFVQRLPRLIPSQLGCSGKDAAGDDWEKVLTKVCEKSQLILRGAVAREKFMRKALVNRRDEFGNTMLHLAAWNCKADMYDHLIGLGADPAAVNCNGLTPFTLSMRFGLWDIAKHIWERHFKSVYWSFGNVMAENVDYGDFEASALGLSSFATVREIDMCLDALHAYRLALMSPATGGTMDSTEKVSEIMARRVEKRSTAWCLSLVERFLMEELPSPAKTRREGPEGKDEYLRLLPERTRKLWNKYRGKEEVPNTPKLPVRTAQVKCAVRLITMFRPDGWYEQWKNLMEEVVLSKWSRGYYLVHIGDSLVPYCFLILLFGFMWWQRRLNVLEHGFWWTEDRIAAPDPELGVEAACGWRSIRDSNSGTLQAVLVLYGVPSLLRLGMVQSRLRPTDLDENVDWKITSDELVNMAYLNLESLLHTVVAGLFLTIGVARVAAGQGCDIWYVQVEKNATAIAALGLFFNLFILCKPYKGFGLLVLTWYRFLIAEFFNFFVMYSMIFVAFLIAVQTLNNANDVFIRWMEQSEDILPQVQDAIRVQYPDANAAGDLTYMVNDNVPPTATQLLATQTAVSGCQPYRRSLVDTGFALLEISFGDGLADALEQARPKPYQCAGFVPDYLLGYLLMLWVFLTNTLIMNMLIAMMNNTFDQQRESLHKVWLLDISKRIMRYESSFPELARRISRPEHTYSMLNRSYWRCKLEDLAVILFCIPEVHFVALFSNFICIRRASDRLQARSEWQQILQVLKFRESRDSNGVELSERGWGVFCQNVTNVTWIVSELIPTSRKAVAFGQAAEDEQARVGQAPEVDSRSISAAREAEGGQDVGEDKRVVALIYRLERLKAVLSNRKRKTHDSGVASAEAGAEPAT